MVEAIFVGELAVWLLKFAILRSASLAVGLRPARCRLPSSETARRTAAGMPRRPADDRGRRRGDPVGDAESTEFGEVAVVESEKEMTLAGAEALQRMAVAAREIPGVAGTEFGRSRIGHWA